MKDKQREGFKCHAEALLTMGKGDYPLALSHTPDIQGYVYMTQWSAVGSEQASLGTGHSLNALVWSSAWTKISLHSPTLCYMDIHRVNPVEYPPYWECLHKMFTAE